MTREEAILAAICEADDKMPSKRVEAFTRALAESGWAVVPVEATEEMLAAGGFTEIPKRFYSDGGHAPGTEGAAIVYRAMLSAVTK